MPLSPGWDLRRGRLSGILRGNELIGEIQMQSNGSSACGLPGVRWRKSSYSNPSGNCVELAELTDGGVAVRNSRHPNGPVLIYTRAEMVAFLCGAKDGDFDDLFDQG